ncbi:ubiE/COQ5 methyltransferase family protein [Anaerovirgula multivorans]|uniref:UbiE/COQ5 methyltransferase family protein n=1 Tax=Anaerovirgula multivorans TaxID=312168 RepID=A0A239JZF8_9FIRM|nr:class I SAM-dependent methyltransferase [Anaerovirgula multivorans]SNT11125.1 ubiE/COQ5 methyltransferase family protein [Anaerovirgula multivorans]
MQKNQINFQQTKKFMNKIDFLDGVQRKEFLPPEEILSRLSINKSDSILDVGAGSGFLTIPVAKMVNETVFALDIDQRMLKVIQAKAKDRNIENIKLLHGNIDNIPLPAESIDIVLASLILHEVRPLPEVINQIGGVLKIGGHLLCLEYEKDERFVQDPPMNIRIKSSELEEELTKAGFNVVRKQFTQESIYIIVAKKKEA